MGKLDQVIIKTLGVCVMGLVGAVSFFLVDWHAETKTTSHNYGSLITQVSTNQNDISIVKQDIAAVKNKQDSMYNLMLQWNRDFYPERFNSKKEQTGD